jgi:hypothetical protein
LAAAGQALPPPTPLPRRHGRQREAWCATSRTECFEEGVTVGAVRLLDLSGRSRVRVAVGAPVLSRSYFSDPRLCTDGVLLRLVWRAGRVALACAEGDLMRLVGWTGTSMLDRYAEDLQVQRASRPSVGEETSTERIRSGPAQ